MSHGKFSCVADARPIGTPPKAVNNPYNYFVDCRDFVVVHPPGHQHDALLRSDDLHGLRWKRGDRYGNDLHQYRGE